MIVDQQPFDNSESEPLMQPTPGQSPQAGLLHEVRELLRREPMIEKLMPLDGEQIRSEAQLLAHVLATASLASADRDALKDTILSVLVRDPIVLNDTMADLDVTSGHNVEPGGRATTLLFSRGIHAMLAHRVSHSVWRQERYDLALALKTIFGRAFSTDIHPAARFGRGIWLDHGLGFVVGETAVIADNVSIWHGVTLGSTLKNKSNRRHPRVGQGVTIGADAIILGDVEVGEFSVIAAGSIVLTDVAPRTTVAGVPARQKPRTAASFAGF